LKIEINHGKRGGSLRIEYRTLEQLEGVLALLNPR